MACSRWTASSPHSMKSPPWRASTVLLGTSTNPSHRLPRANGRGSAEVKGVMDRIDIFTARWARPWAARSAFHHRQARSDRNAAPAFAPLPVSRTRCRRTWWLRASRRSTCCPRPVNCANGWRPIPRISARDDRCGFDIKPGVHPISPVMLYDAPLARSSRSVCWKKASTRWLLLPGVPQGQARIRTQMSDRAYPRAPRPRNRRVHQDRPRAGRS